MENKKINKEGQKENMIQTEDVGKEKIDRRDVERRTGEIERKK